MILTFKKAYKKEESTINILKYLSPRRVIIMIFTRRG